MTAAAQPDEAGFAEPATDEVGQHRVVFDQQCAHRVSV